LFSLFKNPPIITTQKKLLAAYVVYNDYEKKRSVYECNDAQLQQARDAVNVQISKLVKQLSLDESSTKELEHGLSYFLLSRFPPNGNWSISTEDIDLLCKLAKNALNVAHVLIWLENNQLANPANKEMLRALDVLSNEVKFLRYISFESQLLEVLDVQHFEPETTTPRCSIL
jgi:hypothetical protein